MNTFRKSIVILLLLSMCISAFASCGGNQSEDPADSSSAAESTSEAVGGEKYDIITIAKALELCGESGNITTERYYIKGEVVAITDGRYGSMTVKDETGTISVYGTYSADGSISYADMADKPYKGDTVILHCILQNYNGTKEVKNARLISFEKGNNEVNAKDYTDMSVAEAREAAEGTKIKVDGVVAQITYSNGVKPAGIILADNTQSIYVYDAELAGRVKVGNTVTVLGSKTYWVLDTEQSSAQKFGYKGCCQLEDVTVVSVDESVKEFDKSWVKTTTVKELLDTPVSENITSSIYKVNALVKKVDGKGFINYYFYDLDGKTGSYTYTQSNGNDFKWLDEFDGKICTVYLMVLNAKSSATECFFRLLPVEVKDEGFKFDIANTAEHIVKYYGIPQFNASYTGNPALELTTEVSSDLLHFEDAVLTYTSSDTSVISFEQKDGKVIFNCLKSGKATVTVKGSYLGKDYSETVEITVGANETYDTITVKDAQTAAEDSTVIVKGIVGPSVVNKTGFYLFDETGMIAIIVNDAEIFKEIKIGQEIVIKGRREEYKKDGKTHAGQICIVDAEVLANYYGDHKYPETGFITDKTLADIANLNVNEYHSTEVYVVKATVNIVETAYYTSINLTSGDVKLSLYCSGAGQYSFLKQFAGQEVTLEIAPCNWNDKNYYAGCVIAVRTADGKILNELNFIH